LQINIIYPSDRYTAKGDYVVALWQTRKSGPLSIGETPFYFKMRTDPDLLKIMEIDYGFLRIANDISLMYQEVDRKDGHNINCGSVRFLQSLRPKEAVALYFKGLQEPKDHFLYPRTGITMECFYNYHYNRYGEKLMLRNCPDALEASRLSILFDKKKDLHFITKGFNIENCVPQFISWTIDYDAYYCFRYLIEKYKVIMTQSMYEMSLKYGNKISSYLETESLNQNV